MYPTCVKVKLKTRIVFTGPFAYLLKLISRSSL